MTNPEPVPEQPAETSEDNLVVCEVFSGCKCSICGRNFAEGDDICSGGGHEIGQRYPKMT